MTRINAFIPPAELSDKHLIAEHREIKRIPNMIKSGKAVVKDIPEKFTLGKGHVKFFYNKLSWLHTRYNQIYNECVKRGFNIQNYNPAFDGMDNANIDYGEYLKLYNDWLPNSDEVNRIRAIIRQRITDNNNRPKKVKSSVK
jgi:hypothetical protein